MRYTRFVCLFLGLLLVFACAAQAADVEGYLTDKMCAAKGAKDAAAAKAHTKECAMMPDCQKSGYAVITSDGKVLAFDDAGNKEAVKALKASKKKDDLKVKVSGDVAGDKIKVASLKLL